MFWLLSGIGNSLKGKRPTIEEQAIGCSPGQRAEGLGDSSNNWGRGPNGGIVFLGFVCLFLFCFTKKQKSKMALNAELLTPWILKDE